MRSTKVILSFVALSLWSSVAFAAGAVSFGPQIGFSKSSDTDAKALYGAGLRVKFLPALGVEGSIAYRQDEFAADTGTMRSWPVQVTGLFYPLSVAYAGVGAGWYNTTFDYDDSVVFSDDTQQEFGWHFGGGLELPMGEVMKFTADLRYVYLDYNFETVPGAGDTQDDFYMVTGGLLFNL